MSKSSPITAPAHVLELLSRLHQTSLEQERAISKKGKVFSTDFIALDENKCHFLYQLIHAKEATNIVEAGTSFGVSTIYLALAVRQVKLATGKTGTVIATEKEPEKAKIARQYWRQCGTDVEAQIDLREGDILETLKNGLPNIDLVLLDIWSALALPTLKLIQPKLRQGAVVLIDNIISGATGYAELISYLKAPENGPDALVGYEETGQELLNQLPDGIDAFCGGVGSAGMRMSRALKANFPEVQVVALGPASSTILTKEYSGSHGIDGIGTGSRPVHSDWQYYDHSQAIEEQDAIKMCQRLAKEEGLLVGISTGLNVSAALNLGRELGPGKGVVTVACDTELKYLGGSLIVDAEWRVIISYQQKPSGMQWSKLEVIRHGKLVLVCPKDRSMDASLTRILR
ncbi:Pyridoxal-phosphate dependent enzyme-like protein 2 [Elsinoe fawcettii]|nr:Pyridoxal-phosphate dependent enzyme-like protein 2 [Elsinoe fawcettii]